MNKRLIPSPHSMLHALIGVIESRDTIPMPYVLLAISETLNAYRLYNAVKHRDDVTVVRIPY